MGKAGTEVSRLAKGPILAPLPGAWDVPATGGWFGDDTSLLGFLSAISASTLKGRIATLGLPGSSVGLRLVCMSPLPTRTERGGRSSLFKAALKADIAIAGAIQVRLARVVKGERTVVCIAKRGLHKLGAVRPKVTVSSCLCDQSDVQAIIRQAWGERQPIRGRGGPDLV